MDENGSDGLEPHEREQLDARKRKGEPYSIRHTAVAKEDGQAFHKFEYRAWLSTLGRTDNTHRLDIEVARPDRRDAFDTLIAMLKGRDAEPTSERRRK